MFGYIKGCISEERKRLDELKRLFTFSYDIVHSYI